MARGKAKGKRSAKSLDPRSKQPEEPSPVPERPAEDVEATEAKQSGVVEVEPVEHQPLRAETRTEGSPISAADKSDSDEEDFTQLALEKTVISLPLFNEFKKKRPVYDVIIDVNLLYHAGREEAKRQVQRLIVSMLKDSSLPKKAAQKQGVNLIKTRYSQQYVFAVLEEELIKELVRRDSKWATREGVSAHSDQAIYHIWPDFEVKKLTTKSISTVKADAARNAFSALGEGIYWAVMDSGIDVTHPHFVLHENLILPPKPDPLQHRDFTVLGTELSNTDEDISKEIDMTVGTNEKPLEDEFGHGTHVAGIIAGELRAEGRDIIAATSHMDESGSITSRQIKIKPVISGMAPKCKLVSLKVLDKDGGGQASNLIAAIQWIQEINGSGRLMRIHGVNMSVGYEFDPEWFACGQSPLCVEVDRLVKSGVVVVVAAGNTGYGFVKAEGKRNAVTAGLDLTINDPGNADLAITVGSTHREKPHMYGVSYFSSKGPTGDGRLKPDLVAPGEKIISCDSVQRRAKKEGINTERINTERINTERINAATAPAANEPPPGDAGAETKPPGYYRESSGTSMAAPHVSGVIAAFLSVRREFIGRPDVVKEIFMSTATDLKRERYFQGQGLVDLMRAIQSV